MTLKTANVIIRLLDITAMDYYSKSDTAFSKSKTFRDELWRRRYNLHKNRESYNFDIEEVFTRNMNQDDLKQLLQYQMNEAVKLMNFYLQSHH